MGYGLLYMVPAAEPHGLKPQGANDGGLTTHYAATSTMNISSDRSRAAASSA